MESNTAHPRLTFEVLQARIVRLITLRIQNGDFTERGLARIIGVSQPQVHNVLKGARKMQPWLGDRLLVKLDLTIMDLLEEPEISELVKSVGAEPAPDSAVLPIDIMSIPCHRTRIEQSRHFVKRNGI